jgi:hypothetical protein
MSDEQIPKLPLSFDEACIENHRLRRNIDVYTKRLRDLVGIDHEYEGTGNSWTLQAMIHVVELRWREKDTEITRLRQQLSVAREALLGLRGYARRIGDAHASDLASDALCALEGGE